MASRPVTVAPEEERAWKGTQERYKERNTKSSHVDVSYRKQVYEIASI